MSSDLPETLWEFSIPELNSTEKLDFSELKGKVVLIINVASFCGLTAQYWDLNKLQSKYEAQGLQIVGCPCPQFGLQEIGAESEIMNCLKYVRPGNGYPGPNFPLTRKLLVNGPDAHPLYKWLKARAPEAPLPHVDGLQWLDNTGARTLHLVPAEGSDVPWNFHKFLVARDGKTVKRFHSSKQPLDPELTAAIEEFLNAK